jgi:transposase
MNKLDLTPKAKLKLELRHQVCKHGKERDRIKAVLLYSEDWSVSMISQALRINESTVRRHIQDYASGKLSPSNGGSASALDENQTAELVAELSDTMYHHVHEIIAHVEKTYNLIYSVPGMNKWLHGHGFSYKKPKGQPYKLDRDRQASFIKKYKRLKKRVGSEDKLLFMDSVHPTQATKLGYGWIKTGKTKQINTSASRTRVNLVGAIELGNLGKAQVCEYEKINALTIVDFMSSLRKKYTSTVKIHLILDQAGYHRALDVREAAKKLGIKLHYLPPYSPNLNPIERLWKVMNEYARNNRFFETPKKFRDALTNFFEKTLPDIADSLNSRINDNFQLL